MKPRLGLWITLAVALAYVAYLGAHWLPLGLISWITSWERPRPASGTSNSK